jgi:hypothetical protein
MKKLFLAAKYIIAGATVAVALYFFVGSGIFLEERRDISFGITFSTLMARQLELDPQKVFDAAVDDLGARAIRIPVYWSEVESERGKFDFSEYDYFIHKSEKSGAKLILAVGRKLPRWPECHIPAWAINLTEKEFEERVLMQIEEAVKHFRNSPAVAGWQVENEHFHIYGADCAAGKLKSEVVDKEIAKVRSLDSRPIVLTDAGKAGTWFTSLWKGRADIVGVTMYYQVWNSRGAWNSTFGPGLFWLKRKLVVPFFPGKAIINVELQAEPYGPMPLPGYELALQKKLMNAQCLREYARRARRAGFETNYLWGVEWWYWLKEKHNDPSMWEEGKTLFP